MPLPPENDFLPRYNLTQEDLEKGNLSWSSLSEIYADYKKRRASLDVLGRFVQDALQNCSGVHSVRYRTKDPEHLIAKIIRKRRESPSRPLDLATYFSNLTDLVGVRALHLFKDDWEFIHDYILQNWDLYEKPVANIRAGDADQYRKSYEAKGCEVKEHDAGYRSIHYLVKVSLRKTPQVVEIQVRTLFEEGWSEIDHMLRYPNETGNSLLSEQLAVFNRVAGSADEIGTMIKNLRKKQIELEQSHAQQIAMLRTEIAQLKIEASKKAKLQENVNSLDVALSGSGSIRLIPPKWLFSEGYLKDYQLIKTVRAVPIASGVNVSPSRNAETLSDEDKRPELAEQAQKKRRTKKPSNK